MKEWFNVECDLYIHKDSIVKMENGEEGIGYKTVSDAAKHEYELISKRNFQPVTSKYTLDDNSYNVVFINK
ncbi:hypothetical protein [Oceanobacillus sp. FSL H7-0719]|uniref:hypothetical protein n=1 Tax=Oceanobacillus sp. FSL H7-0719 TaxID=2954507 RepID=UPI003243DED9